MKKLQIAGFSALTLLGSMCAMHAQATTPPVGYVTLASVANPIPANTDVRLSVPMEASVDFTGLATSFELNNLTVTGAAFEVDEFAPATGGYYLRIKSGTSLGQTAEITSNTTDTLTLALEAGDDLTNVDATTQIEIVKYFTLSTFFPSDLPNGTNVLFYNNASANVNLAPTTVLVFNAGTWFDTATFNPVGATLYPGESFILRNNSISPITNIVITGNVPTVSHRLVLNAINGNQQDFALSYLSPVSEKIGASGLGFSNGDQLLAYDRTITGLNKAPSTVLTYNSGSWFNTADFSNVTTTFDLIPGEGYVYRKAAGAAGGTEWNTVQSFNQ